MNELILVIEDEGAVDFVRRGLEVHGFEVCSAPDGAGGLEIRPAWLTRYGIALCAVSIVAMGSLFLTMQVERSASRCAQPPGSGGEPDRLT